MKKNQEKTPTSKTKTKEEYREDLTTAFWLIVSLSFVVGIGYYLWFGTFLAENDYSTQAFFYVVISASIIEAYVQIYILTTTRKEFLAFWLSGIVLAFTFWAVNPIMKLEDYKSDWITTKDKTYSKGKVVFYDDTQTIVNNKDGEIFQPGQNTYYRMKHRITTKGSCRVLFKQKMTWGGTYSKDNIYCTEK